MAKKPEIGPELTQREFAALGGKARARVLTKEQASAIGRKAARARWAKARRREKSVA